MFFEICSILPTKQWLKDEPSVTNRCVVSSSGACVSVSAQAVTTAPFNGFTCVWVLEARGKVNAASLDKAAVPYANISGEFKWSSDRVSAYQPILVVAEPNRITRVYQPAARHGSNFVLPERAALNGSVVSYVVDSRARNAPDVELCVIA